MINVIVIIEDFRIYRLADNLLLIDILQVIKFQIWKTTKSFELLLVKLGIASNFRLFANTNRSL